MDDDQKPGWKVWVDKGAADYGRGRRMAITNARTIVAASGETISRLDAVANMALRQVSEREPLPDFLRGDDVDGFLQAALDAAWGAGMRPSTWAKNLSDSQNRLLDRIPPAQGSGEERSLGEGKVLLVLRVACIRCRATKDVPFAIDAITLVGPAAIEPCRNCGGTVFRCG